jgi:hypothetical protein
MSSDWDGAARSDTTEFIAKPIIAMAENPTTVHRKLPRDARSQGIGLIACRSARAIASVTRFGRFIGRINAECQRRVHVRALR